MPRWKRPKRLRLEFALGLLRERAAERTTTCGSEALCPVYNFRRNPSRTGTHIGGLVFPEPDLCAGVPRRRWMRLCGLQARPSTAAMPTVAEIVLSCNGN